MKMKTYFILLIGLLLIVSCTNNRKPPEIKEPITITSVIAEEDEYEKRKREKEKKKLASEVLRSEVSGKINEMDSLYNIKTKSYKNSILKSVSLNKKDIIKNLSIKGDDISEREQQVRNHMDIDYVADKLLEALKEGDFELFDKLLKKYFFYFDSFNYSPYALYLGEKHDIAQAYTEVYYYYYHLNQKKHNKERKSNMMMIATQFDSKRLEYIGKNEKELALWSLIKAFKMGDINIPLTLSYYFKNGYYLPRDTLTANKLKMIYDNRP